MKKRMENKIIVEKFDNVVKSIIKEHIIEKKERNQITIVEDQKIAQKNSKNTESRLFGLTI